MYRTVSIATLMGLSAGDALFAGYSAPDMAEIIFAGTGDEHRGWADSARDAATERHDFTPVPVCMSGAAR